MSLILEALRKSEAERRRGQAPQLFDSPVTAPPAAPKRSLQAVWWAMPVVLSAALLVSWRYNATAESADTAASGDATGTDGVAQAMPAAPPTPQPSPGTGTRATGSIDAARSVAVPTNPTGRSVAISGSESGPATPVSPGQPATAVPDVRTAETAQARADAVPIGRETRIGDASATLARQPTATAPQVAPAPASRPTPAPAANASQPAIEPALQPPAATTVSTARTPSSTTAVMPARTLQGTKAEPLRLADLTPAERRSLPPLKMSMHMWSADATQRFVILDGARMGEGDRVGEAVIDEITPDGAVLAWSGRRVKVPVR